VWYPDFAIDVQIARGIAMAISAVVIAGFGSIALVRSLRRTGVLEGFPD
jgi:ABC-type thiamin/hydroxymethylpyrimidine transport system permease subunit